MTLTDLSKQTTKKIGFDIRSYFSYTKKNDTDKSAGLYVFKAEVYGEFEPWDHQVKTLRSYQGALYNMLVIEYQTPKNQTNTSTFLKIKMPATE